MAVKGTILGDILGSPYEKHKPRDYETVPLLGQDLRFTDDTVTTLAVKKAILEGSDLTQTMAELCLQHIECGFGGKFFNWIIDDNHKPYGSWGNGSAMRVSFIGEYFTSLSGVEEKAIESAEISHNSPEGIKGAVVVASCIWMAKHNFTKDDIYEYVLAAYPTADYLYSIENTMEELREKYKWSVSCQDTVPVVMRCFYESHDYVSFIRNVFSLDCDADTFCDIGGGVAEEFYHGFGDIDCDYILKTYLPKDLYKILKM